MRLDFIFSYWIFFWYLLYIFGLVRKYNPKFAIICGLIENAFIISLMFYYQTSTKLIILFVIMSMILKIIPLYTLWNKKIKNADIGFSFLLFFIYLFWTFINNQKMDDFVARTKDLIIYNKNTLPGMQFLEKIIKAVHPYQ
jgi:hypothetical protein